MKRGLLAVPLLALLVSANTAYGQTNACATLPTGNIPNPTTGYAVLTDFSVIGPDGTPVTADMTLEIRQGTTVVSTQTLPKSAFLLQSGTPASCYRFTFPVITNIQPGVTYTAALRTNGSGGMSAFNVSSNGFFLQGAPAAPTSFRLALLEWLGKQLAIVRSYLK